VKKRKRASDHARHVLFSAYHFSRVMPALVAGSHVFLASSQLKDVDGRDKPGYDSE
jgi:hypothetical protein